MRLRSATHPPCLRGLVFTSLLVLASSLAADQIKPVAAETSVPKILARIAAEADPDVYAFLNRQRAERLDVQLQQISDPQQGPPLAFALAKELLFAGETEGAIRVFEQIRQILESSGARPDPLIVESLNKFLAIAYLRLGEQENCIEQHSAAACILPLTEDAHHRLERGSRAAVRELMKLTANTPQRDDVWLLNLAWMTLGGYPGQVPEALRIPPEVFASDASLPYFPNVAGALGLDVLAASGGTAMEDFDGDGLLDIVASSWGLADQLRYFHNNGDGSFSDWTQRGGLLGQVGGLNLNHADFNNDGFADLLILRGAWLGEAGKLPNSLLANNGDGTFTDVTHKAELLSFFPTQTAAWADFDLDGHLDLFIGNESTGEFRAPCQLYHNRGDGTFDEIAAQVGLDVIGFVKGVAWGDYDNDGRPDLYLSRFRQPNLLFRNEGPSETAGGQKGWRFREVAAEAGVEDPRESFPVWFWDADNDGWLDLLVAPSSGLDGDALATVVADYLGQPNNGEKPRFYRNLGNGRFADHTAEVNLDKVLLAMGSNYGDLNNDGDLDAYFGTGEPNLATLIPNRMFLNQNRPNQKGQRFQDVTSAGGFGHLQKGHGVAFGDLDNDGDQDIYVVMGGAYEGDVYQNALFLNPGSENAWVTLLLEGTTSNRAAIGARLRVTVRTPDGSRTLHRVVGTGGSFGSSSLQQEIGFGNATAIESIEIAWPSKRPTETFIGVELGGFFRLREGEGKAIRLQRRVVDLGAKAAGHAHGSQASVESGEN